MRRFLILVVVWLGLGVMSPLSAQEREIEGVIAGQMQAFRDGDVEGAFGFASPGIRRFFGTSERFGAMVRGGYPMVWQPGELRFLELREIAGQLWQKIEIRDAAGGLHWLDYQMIPVGDGWRINAVQILVAPPPSV